MKTKVGDVVTYWEEKTGLAHQAVVVAIAEDGVALLKVCRATRRKAPGGIDRRNDVLFSEKHKPGCWGEIAG